MKLCDQLTSNQKCLAIMFRACSASSDVPWIVTPSFVSLKQNKHTILFGGLLSMFTLVGYELQLKFRPKLSFKAVKINSGWICVCLYLTFTVT